MGKSGLETTAKDGPPGFSFPELDSSIKESLIQEFSEVPAEVVAEAQLCRWLGVSMPTDVSMKTVVTPVKGIHANLAISGTKVEVNDSTHALLSIVMKERGGEAGRAHIPDLTIHWGISAHEGSQWVTPPPGCYYYPSTVLSPLADKVAWRIPFAKHVSPDGLPLYVALLQLPISTGVLENGGLCMVLTANDGTRWMHNYQTGKDWFVQLSHWLPTTPAAQLPMHPLNASDVPSANSKALKDAMLSPVDVEEQMDIAVLRKEDAEAAKLHAKVEAAQAALSTHERKRDEASAEADQEAQLASAPPPHAPAPPPPLPPLHLPTPPSPPPRPSAGGSESDEGASGEESAISAVLAEQHYAEGFAEKLRAHTKEVERLEAEHARAEEERAKLIAKMEKEHHTACTEAALARTRAEAASAEARARVAAESEAVKAAQADLRKAEEAERKFLAEAAEARARQAGRQRTRQLAHLLGQMSLEGPEMALDLSRLTCSSIPTGRNFPVVPGAGGQNQKLTLDSWDIRSVIHPPEPCTYRHLQLVAGQQMRKFLGIHNNGELHVLQYRYEIALQRGGFTPGGGKAPLMVWVTCVEEPTEDENVTKNYAVVAILTDGMVEARPDSGLTLRWGGSMREGGIMSPAMPPGWSTSPSYSWDGGDSAWCTPFSKHGAPTLDKYTDSGNHSVMCCILKLPTEEVFSHGGLSFQVRNCTGELLNNPATGRMFFLDLQPLGYYGMQYIHAHTVDVTQPSIEEEIEVAAAISGWQPQDQEDDDWEPIPSSAEEEEAAPSS